MFYFISLINLYTRNFSSSLLLFVYYYAFLRRVRLYFISDPLLLRIIISQKVVEVGGINTVLRHNFLSLIHIPR